MDSQHFEYWQPQQDGYAQPQATYYEYTPDLGSIPSLSASPTSTATFDAGTPTPTRQSSMQQQRQHQPQQQQQQHVYHQTQPPPTSYSAFAYQVPVISSDFGAAAAGALPSPPYVCSPQQSSADLGGYALSPPPDSSATFPLQIVNEQGFGQGRAPPARSASNGSSWSAGSSGGGSGGGVQTERTHVTSGRRRAQNRAAQRAFRERKEQHAKDLEAQLRALSDRYGRLEQSHAQLNEAYEKLRRTIELLTSSSSTSPASMGDDDDDYDDDVDGEGEHVEDLGRDADALLARALGRTASASRRTGSEGETVRKLVGIMHGGEGGQRRRTTGVKCEV